MNLMRQLKPLIASIARPALAQRVAPDAIAAVVDDAFADYASQRPDLPREASAGGRAMVHFAALTTGLYRVLLRRGVSPAEARSLTSAVTWRAYAQMARLPTALSRLGRGSARARVKRATDLFRRFPFSAPSYEMVDVEGGADIVAFDVRRCPVAAYFGEHKLGELCVESWCNLDYPLAEKWGARLERSQTLAGGAGYCDFRWRVRGTASAVQPSLAGTQR